MTWGYQGDRKMEMTNELYRAGLPDILTRHYLYLTYVNIKIGYVSDSKPNPTSGSGTARHSTP